MCDSDGDDDANDDAGSGDGTKAVVGVHVRTCVWVYTISSR